MRVEQSRPCLLSRFVLSSVTGSLYAFTDRRVEFYPVSPLLPLVAIPSALWGLAHD